MTELPRPDWVHESGLAAAWKQEGARGWRVTAYRRGAPHTKRSSVYVNQPVNALTARQALDTARMLESAVAWLASPLRDASPTASPSVETDDAERTVTSVQEPGGT